MPITPPQSSVARFGVSLTGPRFEWSWLARPDDAPEDSKELAVVTRAFRAHPGISFEEFADYQAQSSMLQAGAAQAQRELARVVNEIMKDEATSEHDKVTALDGVARATVESERVRWEVIVDQTLMLVAPADREQLRPLLLGGNPTDVRALKEHLEDVVINRAVVETEVVGQVDPTSQPSSNG